MEAADALYGISMQGDGVSSVVSQRLREPERRLSTARPRDPRVVAA